MLKVEYNSPETAVVYHTWNQEEGTVLCIASLRGAGCDSKVYVIQRDTYKGKWGHYPELLNFEVVNWPYFFEGKTRDRHSMITSRQIDIWNFVQTIPQKVILYSDTDVFWAKSPLPFHRSTDLVVKNLNDGLFYFDKESEAARNYFGMYQEYAIKGMKDEDFRNYLWSLCHWYSDAFWLGNESTSNAIQKEHPEWFRWMDDCEHAIKWGAPHRREKTFHSMGFYEVKNEVFSKWAFAFLIEEVHRNVSKFDLDFSEKYEWLLPHQVRLRDPSLTKLIDQLF